MAGLVSVPVGYGMDGPGLVFCGEVRDSGDANHHRAGRGLARWGMVVWDGVWSALAS
jgi:hypothetical protein